MSQHIVELNVVDLIRGFGLEASVNESEFLFAREQLHVVED